MDPNVYVNLGLTILNNALQLIAKLKADAGLTDDQILAAAQQANADNAAQIAKLLAGLSPAPAPVPPIAPIGPIVTTTTDPSSQPPTA